nr:immunoglobulin heavy chain junction region [Macaca mulatta]MOV49833.1 immunoglobulin heavy chain junction region [Macaca mulatta]MOV50122.1 immunoglobulin heavy chain junction region [Macaca mulatta]MOV50307.1 immunoglobulin heavy chain junction region [Macaca mulatta]MOV50445.1 immunoglobulin heavy chain junction region [Macaca mulatta]
CARDAWDDYGSNYILMAYW